MAGGAEAPAAKPEARAGGPGLGDAKRPAAPPREARGSREAGAGRKAASKTSGASPRGGPWGGGPSGQKRKRAALRAIFYVRG